MTNNVIYPGTKPWQIPPTESIALITYTQASSKYPPPPMICLLNEKFTDYKAITNWICRSMDNFNLNFSPLEEQLSQWITCGLSSLFMDLLCLFLKSKDK